MNRLQFAAVMLLEFVYRYFAFDVIVYIVFGFYFEWNDFNTILRYLPAREREREKSECMLCAPTLTSPVILMR